MAETSFPIVEQPMSAEQWKSVTLGLGDGILDQGGFPYNLTNMSNATNTAVVSVSSTTGYASAIVRGFYHRMDEPRTISLPGVTSTTTYYIALQYDPLREGTPVSLGVFTSLNTSGGKVYVTLWTVRREPNQLLTDATVRHLRPRVAPVQTVAHRSDLQDPSKVLWGSLAVIHGGANGEDRDLVVAKSGDESTASGWESLIDPDWLTVNDYENSVGGAGNGGPKQLQRVGKTRRMQGRVGRRDGSAYTSASGAGYLIATLGSLDTPRYTKSPLVRCGGGTNGSKAHGFVAIDKGNSEVRLYITEGSCLWVDLGTIEWTV